MGFHLIACCDIDKVNLRCEEMMHSEFSSFVRMTEFLILCLLAIASSVGVAAQSDRFVQEKYNSSTWSHMISAGVYRDLTRRVSMVIEFIWLFSF